MAKASGSTRMIKRIPVSTKTLHGIFNEFLNSGLYDPSRSFVTYAK